MRCVLDHLVVACRDLDQGSAWLSAQLGVEPQPGGKHALMGTHNRLLRLGDRTYLELIAVDPDAPPPARPRWFGLDTDEVRQRIERAPVLLTWVARCDHAVEAVMHVPELGAVHAASRGSFSWRITIPDDGSLQFGGMLPAVIQWEGDAHPADGLDQQGCELVELALAHPMSAGLVPMFRALRIAGPVDLRAGPKSMVARVRAPSGEVVELS
jgi:hypothetical protein